MKLADHVEQIRQLIDNAFRNRLGRMGITASALQPATSIPVEYWEDRKRIDVIRETWAEETGAFDEAYEKLVEEFTFTLFNRLAALKVMEAHTLHPEIVTRRSQHGDRSFAHVLWLEQNPAGRNDEMEGLVLFLEDQLDSLKKDIPLFSLDHPYHLLPTAIELNGIINSFNQVEMDEQVGSEIWKSDDVLGWLYESYNNYKKHAHKDSKAKTEYSKVSIQSQVYTPRWVVKFLVDNSLGKLYLEMFPDSAIQEKYKIANAPQKQIREKKPLAELRLIDPATGSGNFLLYAFDLFYDLYMDQIDNYGADYDEKKIPELIIHNNLYGIDLDDRAVQLAQLALYIKAKRKKRSAHIEYFNVVSSDFFLPEYSVVSHLFENVIKLHPELEQIVIDIWSDLQDAYKFGSLIRLEEKFAHQLHKLESRLEQPQMSMFETSEMETYDNFRKSFFKSLKEALAHNTEEQGITFLNTKTSDAITFLEIMTQKYDIAVANPPYTDSSDFGPELKKFVDENYKQPHKFNANLYTVFIKRSYELVNAKGKVALIHPLTFMYIKSFEDVRKYLLEKTHIRILAELGLGGIFANSDVQADVVAYILEKQNLPEKSIFLDFKKYKNHTNKPVIFSTVYDNLMKNLVDDHIHIIAQSNLKIIGSYPFIYWISDGFREKFKEKDLDSVADVKVGINSGSNERFVRFWWEVNSEEISVDYSKDQLKWVGYAKGGPFKKWYGNLWLKISWENKGSELRNYAGSILRNEEFYFKEGITYSASGSKGVSFRYLPANYVFDVGGSCIFPKKKISNSVLLGLLNSKLTFYIADCLNPTVNTQVGDLKRIPFIKPKTQSESCISYLASKNIEIKMKLCSWRVIETNFQQNPLTAFTEPSLADRILAHFNYENAQLSLVLLNEAIINKLIFEVYDLSPIDREQIEIKMGKSVAELPLLEEAKQDYLAVMTIENNTVQEFVQNLSSTTLEEQQIQLIKSEFTTLYQNNNDLEEFCIRHQINPVNVWYWFHESKALPQGRTTEIALEFLTDACRTILMEDNDGIIPLVGLPDETRLLDRLEKHCLNHGFTSAQFMQIEGLLGRPINEYLEHHFLKNLSDHLKLFKHLPSTPFIWHLSSGAQQGFEAYIIIYKWNRDSLYKLKIQYLSKRAERLEYRQIELADSNTAQAQNEKETIRLQLQEIAAFTNRVDELIAEGYDPKLDDGVGKNIAPLQQKGMLRSDVLNAKQLEKYLKADW